MFILKAIFCLIASAASAQTFTGDWKITKVQYAEDHELKPYDLTGTVSISYVESKKMVCMKFSAEEKQACMKTDKVRGFNAVLDVSPDMSEFSYRHNARNIISEQLSINFYKLNDFKAYIKIERIELAFERYIREKIIFLSR